MVHWCNIKGLTGPCPETIALLAKCPPAHFKELSTEELLLLELVTGESPHKRGGPGNNEISKGGRMNFSPLLTPAREDLLKMAPCHFHYVYQTKKAIQEGSNYF